MSAKTDKNEQSFDNCFSLLSFKVPKVPNLLKRFAMCTEKRHHYIKNCTEMVFILQVELQPHRLSSMRTIQTNLPIGIYTSPADGIVSQYHYPSHLYSVSKTQMFSVLNEKKKEGIKINGEKRTNLSDNIFLYVKVERIKNFF